MGSASNGKDKSDSQKSSSGKGDGDQKAASKNDDNKKPLTKDGKTASDNGFYYSDCCTSGKTLEEIKKESEGKSVSLKSSVKKVPEIVISLKHDEKNLTE